MSVSPERAEQRVLIVEDHRLFAETVDLALTVEGYDVRRIEVPADPGSPGALVAAIVKQQPLVVLLDLDLGRFGDGVRLIEPIAALRRQRRRGHRLDRPRPVGRCGPGRRPQGALEVTAAARHPRDRAPDRRRAAGDGPRGARGAGLGVDQDRERSSRRCRERLEQLTNRESVVLGHLMKGRAVRQIAGLSMVSEATVRTQVKSILAKLEVSSQLAAVGMAHEIGWRAPA